MGVLFDPQYKHFLTVVVVPFVLLLDRPCKELLPPPLDVMLVEHRLVGAELDTIVAEDFNVDDSLDSKENWS